MRYTILLIAAIIFVSFPLRTQAADNSASSSASALSTAVYSSPSSAMGQISITDAPSNDNQSAVRETKTTQGERDSRISGEKLSKSNFQTFVATSTGDNLDVFGQELFRNVPSTYAPLGAVQVNPDYVIGMGDLLQVRGWGMIDINVNVMVNRSGEIYLPRVGSIQVAGVKYRDLQGYLKKAVGRIFTHFDLSASIAQTRSVQIYVVGHAQRPGTYTLSAMSTLLNALFASGGPSVTGSMRNIKLKRSGEADISFDLYDILLRGDKSSDVALRDGDVLYIPSVGALAAILGDVKKPAIFELKQKTSLADMVDWAGGFESVAGLQKVIVEKSVDSRYQTVAELPVELSAIEKNLAQLVVEPTTIIRVTAPGSVPLEVKLERDFVRVDGEVKQSGMYELQKGETLKALISRIGGTTDKAYVFGTKLTRASVKREQQLKIDEAIDRYEKDIETNAKQRVSGQSDPTQAAAIAAELEAQRSLVKKLRQVKSEGRIILNLNDFKAVVSDLPDFPLKDGDIVYIPQYMATVDIIGAVYQQNTFIYRPERRVDDYILLAGGVTPTGDQSELYRICADGTVRSKRHSWSGGAVNPGDAIVVPEKIQRGASLMQNIKDITTILYQFGLGAAGLKTLKN